MQIRAFTLVFNKRKRKEVKLPLFGKRNDRAFGSIILDTHHPILISFHYETIYNLPLGSRIIRTTLEKSLIGCGWGSPDLPAFERWLLIAKLTFPSTSFSIFLPSYIFLFTIQSNRSTMFLSFIVFRPITYHSAWHSSKFYKMSHFLPVLCRISARELFCYETSYDWLNYFS